MRKLIALLVSACALASAQQPQTQTAPTFPVNAKYVNGVAPGYAPSAGSGLTLALGAGTANCAGTIETYAGGTLAMSASSTNYVYLDTGAACAPAVKTTAFTSSDIPIATVVAGSASITSIADVRTMFFQSSPGTGGSSAHGVVLPLTQNSSGSVVLSPNGNYQTAPFSFTVASCTWTTTTSDSSTALTLDVKFNGTSILSAPVTIAAGTSAGTVTSLTLSGSPAITAGHNFELDVTAGTSSWNGVVSCHS